MGIINIKVGDVVQFTHNHTGISPGYGDICIMRKDNEVSLYNRNRDEAHLITSFHLLDNSIEKVFSKDTYFQYKIFNSDCYKICQTGIAYLDHRNDLIDEHTGEIISLGKSPSKFVALDLLSENISNEDEDDDDILNKIYNILR